MNVLSLFDGISAGQVALERAGIEVTNYYAAEIDKYAIKITMANYPNTIQLGDVTKWRDWVIDWPSIDLLIGGSPCQGFSFAGKQLAFDDPRSALFFVYVDILNHIKSVNPNVKFLLENVRMKKEHLAVITEHLGVEPVFINSALLSAQNRQRYYWANWEFGLPEDKGILLKDIIEIGFADRGKSLTVTTRVAGATAKRYLEKSMHQMVIERPCKLRWFNKESLCHHIADATDIKGNQSIKRVYAGTGKAPTLSTCQGGHSAMRGRYLVDGKRQDHKIKTAGLTTQRLEIRGDEKTNSLTTVQKDNVLTKEGLFYRKLTPLECERLQTFPDNFTAHVSNTQRYKALGNSWTVDVVAHIFKEGKLSAWVCEKLDESLA